MEIDKLAEIFEAVKVMPLRPNDVIVFKTKQIVSQETARRIREMLQEHLGGRKILVLSDGAELEVLREEVAAAATIP